MSGRISSKAGSKTFSLWEGGIKARVLLTHRASSAFGCYKAISRSVFDTSTDTGGHISKFQESYFGVMYQHLFTMFVKTWTQLLFSNYVKSDATSRMQLEECPRHVRQKVFGLQTASGFRAHSVRQ